MTLKNERLDISKLPYVRVGDDQHEHPSDIADRLMRSEVMLYGIACNVGSPEDIRDAADRLKEAIERAVRSDRTNGCGND